MKQVFTSGCGFRRGTDKECTGVDWVRRRDTLQDTRLPTFSPFAANTTS